LQKKENKTSLELWGSVNYDKYYHKLDFLFATDSNLYLAPNPGFLPRYTTYLEGKPQHYSPREPACSSEGFGYACIIMPDLTLFSCAITDWDISFSAHLSPVLPQASGACLERCQYSYDQFSGITDRPSVRIDMFGYSCLLQEMIICLIVSNDCPRYTCAQATDGWRNTWVSWKSSPNSGLFHFSPQLVILQSESQILTNCKGAGCY